jgi:hypothetical protein
MKRYHIELTVEIKASAPGVSAQALNEAIAHDVAETLKDLGVVGTVKFEGVVTDCGPFSGAEVN